MIGISQAILLHAEEGMGAWSSFCSRNARPQKGLVRRPQSRINQAIL